MREIYRPLYLIETPIVMTNRESAELIKYAANAFLAVKIGFINEIANLCDRVGADVHIVAKGMGLDKRIGAKFLHPGPGYGGSCFPKDTRALAALGAARGTPQRIVQAAIEVNDKQRELIVEKIRPRSARCAAAASLCSACRSSRTPATCVNRRRSTSAASSSPPAPPSARSTLWRPTRRRTHWPSRRPA